MRANIIPSAPFKSYEEIEILAMKVKGELKRIQIDVCDGKFVPSVSWPFTEYPKGEFENLGKKPDFDVYLPFWESINYSADLMVDHPEKYIETFVSYGIDEILVHYRSQHDFKKLVEYSKKYELNLVMAVDVKTDVDEFIKFAKENIEDINAFQVMGIEKIGFQGQPFEKKSLEIVKLLKKNFKDKLVYMDGGEDEDTVEEIKEAGVDVFCVGHYLTQADNFDDNLQTLKNLLR